MSLAGQILPEEAEQLLEEASNRHTGKQTENLFH
jgi:hypothetical protein